MCYAIPAKIVAINGDIGTVDYFGEQRRILLDLEFGIKVGDYVFAQGGVLVRKIRFKEAQEILAAWKDIFFELQKTDQKLSAISEQSVSENVLGVLQKINHKQKLSSQEMVTLLQLKADNELKVLYEVANHVRQKEHGNASCVHGIIEFSNCCRCNCHYCGIRKDRNIHRYQMSVDEIIASAKNAVSHGFKALVLQSGEDCYYDEKTLVKIVKEVRHLGVLVFISIGMRENSLYESLYKAGARAALLRFETSNAKIFQKLRPGTTLAARLKLIKDFKKIGYVLATGFMLGLPGETAEDIVNNILLTKKLAPDMYSFGPLIPTQNTPLQDCAPVAKDLVLRTIAVSRLVDPGANILVTTALETLAKKAKKEALLAGANSLMINVTPTEYRRLYTIYDGKVSEHQDVKFSIQEIIDLLYSLGRAPIDLGV